MSSYNMLIYYAWIATHSHAETMLFIQAGTRVNVSALHAKFNEASKHSVSMLGSILMHCFLKTSKLVLKMQWWTELSTLKLCHSLTNKTGFFWSTPHPFSSSASQNPESTFLSSYLWDVLPGRIWYTWTHLLSQYKSFPYFCWCSNHAPRYSRICVWICWIYLNLCLKSAASKPIFFVNRYNH